MQNERYVSSDEKEMVLVPAPRSEAHQLSLVNQQRNRDVSPNYSNYGRHGRFRTKHNSLIYIVYSTQINRLRRFWDNLGQNVCIFILCS